MNAPAPNSSLWVTSSRRERLGVSARRCLDTRRLQLSYVANNTFGGNRDKLGVRITDSGRSDRPDTKNVTVESNIMNLDIVKLGTGVSASADNLVLR